MRCGYGPARPTATLSSFAGTSSHPGNGAGACENKSIWVGKYLMRAHSCRAAKLAALIILVSVFLPVTPSFAAPSEINGADTAWMIVATGLVLMMTIPALALFYSGMVRKKNVLATMAQSLAAVALISILWVALGIVLTGIFATASIGGTSGLLEGDPHLLLIQLYGVAATLGWTVAATYLKLVSLFVPLRVSLQQ